MKTDYSTALFETLSHIAQHTTILSPTRFRHPDNLRSHSLTPKAKLDNTEILKYQLANFLYGRYYNNSLRSGTNYLSDQTLVYAGADPQFVTKLREANNGLGYFQQGWQVAKTDGLYHLFVKKDGITLWVNRVTHLEPDKRQANLGDIVSIKFPKDRPFVSPCFYLAIGNTHLEPKSELVRIYFNLTPEISPKLLEELTSALNENNIPFNFKILSNPRLYSRYDNAILYFDRANYGCTQPLLTDLYKRFNTHFNYEIPLFTKYLAPGISLAEDPQENRTDTVRKVESFGQHRSRLLAEGLIKAYMLDKITVKEKVDSMIQRFEETGYSITRPYLNPDAEDNYYW